MNYGGTFIFFGFKNYWNFYIFILYKMERGLTMLLHSILFGVFIYIVMIYLGQSQVMAENRSILLSALVLIYMILFGHGLPNSINKNLF